MGQTRLPSPPSLTSPPLPSPPLAPSPLTLPSPPVSEFLTVVVLRCATCRPALPRTLSMVAVVVVAVVVVAVVVQPRSQSTWGTRPWSPRYRPRCLPHHQAQASSQSPPHPCPQPRRSQPARTRFKAHSHSPRLAKDQGGGWQMTRAAVRGWAVVDEHWPTGAMPSLLPGGGTVNVQYQRWYVYTVSH